MHYLRCFILMLKFQPLILFPEFNQICLCFIHCCLFVWRVSSAPYSADVWIILNLNTINKQHVCLFVCFFKSCPVMRLLVVFQTVYEGQAETHLCWPPAVQHSEKDSKDATNQENLKCAKQLRHPSIVLHTVCFLIVFGLYNPLSFCIS